MSVQTMKAVRLHQYGGPDMLRYEDAPLPSPGPGEVLVRVQAASVNPMDQKIRAGQLKDFMPIQFPFTPGGDIAGVVQSVGPDTPDFVPGQAVLGIAGGAPPAPSTGGGYAEYAVATATHITPIPAGLDFVQAATIPIISLTAWQALFEKGELAQGQTVLIHGGAGGVGGFAVQFAHAAGARVITTAEEDDLEYVRSLGADAVINYKTTGFEEVVADVDMVLDTLGGETQARSWGVLRRGGVLIATPAPPSQDEAARYGVRADMVNVRPDAAQLAQIAAQLAAGALTTRVGAILPLHEAAQAHETSQSGRLKGKIILQVGVDV